MAEMELFLGKSRQRIVDTYAALEQQFPDILEEISRKMEGCGENTALALKYLYGNMPCSDMGNYPFETFLDYASHGVRLWETEAYVRELPEDIFLNYVLYHRVNEEEIVPCRSFFYDKVKERIQGMRGKEAALEVNYWCVEEVTYNCTDERTLSAMATYRRGTGRCGEESTFSVNALRSVGIPARQVYAPRWSHCDDNHAWVEIWCDSNWYFTGACEPVPILNKGWFTNAASRAMMVHSRWFDQAKAPEEIIGKEGMATMLNELKRYAAVKEITVAVQDEAGQPVCGAQVSFEVLNYSEYAPIAQEITDEQGMARLTTGLGSLHLFVSKDGIWAEGCMDTRAEDACRLCLKQQAQSEGWQERDLIAPVDTPVNTESPTKEQSEIGNRRLFLAAEKRTKKTEQFQNPERKAFLAGEASEDGIRHQMLKALTEKDQTDCRCDVLEEHLEYALPYEKSYPKEIFAANILNPRVDDEVLSKYRRAVLETFSPAEQEMFQKDPKKIWDWVDTHIKSCPERERSSVITTPAASLKLGIASARSKEVLFVAAARTLGIPARLNPDDRSMEYLQEGKFVPVLASAEKNCRLILKSGEGTWKYSQNWSMARLTKEGYQTLRLSQKAWENRKLSLLLEAGQYRILTSNRLPNGNQFAYQCEFTLEAGVEKTLELQLRKANLADMLENIPLPDFTLKTEDGEKVQASAIVGEGKSILMWLEESKEPTEHILNEMLEQKEEFLKYEDRIIWVIRTKEALEDPTIAKAYQALPKARIYYDDFTEHVNLLGRRMYVDHEKLPLIIVTDGGMNGIYATSGYNVGTGEMLLRLM